MWGECPYGVVVVKVGCRSHSCTDTGIDRINGVRNGGPGDGAAYRHGSRRSGSDEGECLDEKGLDCIVIDLHGIFQGRSSLEFGTVSRVRDPWIKDRFLSIGVDGDIVGFAVHGSNSDQGLEWRLVTGQTSTTTGTGLRLIVYRRTGSHASRWRASSGDLRWGRVR